MRNIRKYLSNISGKQVKRPNVRMEDKLDIYWKSSEVVISWARKEIKKKMIE